MARKDTVVGLDIGRHAVKAVWAVSKGGSIAIKRSETLRLPLDKSDKQSTILPWLAKMGVASHPCVLSLAGQQAMFQPFVLPPGDPRTYEQAAAMEVVRFNELASETMVYGFAPISLRQGDRRLLLTMARHSVLDEMLALAESAGLDVIDVVPTPVALFNALAGLHSAGDTPWMFVDIGHSATSVAIGSQAGLLFARAFASGGQVFSEALGRTRNLPLAQAENLKLSRAALAPAGSSLAPEFAAAADSWTTELQSCLSVYQSLYREAELRPQRVILAGGASALRGLPELVTSRLGIEAVMLAKLPGAAAVESAEVFAIAAGLAAAGLDLAKARISLLPARLKDDLVFRRQKPYWIAAGIVAALILAVSLAGGARDIGRKEDRLNEQRASLRRRQQLVAQIEAIRARNDQIRSMAAPLKTLCETSALMQQIVDLVSQNKAPEDGITLISDAESYFTKAGKKAAPPEGTSRFGPAPHDGQSDASSFAQPLQRVVIEGYTRKPDLSTVQELISRLGQSPLVASADLLSDDKLMSATPPSQFGDRSMRFVIDVRIKPL